jgi:hypothetical protein
METSWRRDAVMMASLVAALCALTIAFGERIGVNGGVGWDGIAYVEWASDFWQRVVVHGLTQYHSQRVLPSAVVHYALRATGGISTARIIHAFQILDSAALVASGVLWAHLAAHARWSRAARWVGFVALFGGFANARHALYYPTLTDPTAFLLGMLLVWGFVTKHAWAIAAAGFAGIFTWPALPALAAAMLIFPRREVEPAASRMRTRIAAGALAVAGVAAFLAIARHFYLHPVAGVGDDKFKAWVRVDLLWLTVPLLALVLGAGWYVLLRAPRLWNQRAHARALATRRTLGALAVVAAMWLVRAWWVHAIGTQGEGPTTAQFECEHTLAALRGPLWGPVHHVVYFGPIVLVAMLHWRRVADVAARWGPAAVLGLAMIVAFGAGSNSRQWNHLVPLLVAAAIAATDVRWTPARAAVFTVIALAWSKLWLAIGYDQHFSWHEFPNQRYFMNHGPYASDTMYLVHLVAAAITAVIVFAITRREGSRTPPG